MKRSQEEIRKSVTELGRERFILQEMQRFGFWPKDTEEPSVALEILDREDQLRKKLRKLTQERHAQKSTKVQLQRLRKERMQAAKQKRAETKARREEERRARAAAWKEKQAREITYLGESVSHGLSNREADPERLGANNLPSFSSLEALAAAMELSVSKLRWLSYNRKVSETSHYRKFQLPKKSGGTREISAPMPLLKRTQNWVLENILYRVPVTASAHGFVPERGILTNALPHVGKTLVVNMDLQNFFPTITYPRVKGLFRQLGYSEQFATVFALLCTEPETDHVRADGKAFYVQTGRRTLPQGAPGSPAITNLICRRLDARLSGVAAKFGMTYTRYADDLTFSGDDAEHGPVVGKLLWQVRQIIKDEKFVVHPAKTRVQRKGARREVTGIVVNEKPNIARKKLRRFRAVLHQIDRNGPAGKTWGNGGRLFPALHGYAAHVNLVRPDLGPKLLAQVEALWQRYDPQYQSPAQRRANHRTVAAARAGKSATFAEAATITAPDPAESLVPTAPITAPAATPSTAPVAAQSTLASPQSDLSDNPPPATENTDERPWWKRLLDLGS